MPTQTTYDLDGVLAALNQHQQRATYGAVAAVVAQSPRLLMHKRPRAPENSWVVAKSTGTPTGYAPPELHPRLSENATVLSTREELEAWLTLRDAESDMPRV